MSMIHQNTTPAELAARMATRHPHLAAMAAKALALAEGGAVTLIDDHSGTVTNGGGRTYAVQLADDGPQCDCPARLYRPAVINGHYYCKHTVALILALNNAGDELTDEEPDDEPDDDEWYQEMNSGYMRDIGAGIQRWTR